MELEVAKEVMKEIVTRLATTNDGALMILLTVMCGDVIVGVLHYFKDGTFASSACSKGIVKKIGELIVFVVFGLLAPTNKVYETAFNIFIAAATLGELVSFLQHTASLGDIAGLSALREYLDKNTSEHKKEGEQDE